MRMACLDMSTACAATSGLGSCPSGTPSFASAFLISFVHL